MSIFRDEDEKEYIMANLCSSNRFIDMGNFFIMYDEVTTEDMFEFAVSTKVNFYVDTFKYIVNFLVTQLPKGQYTRYAGNFLHNIFLDEYYSAKTIPSYRRRDKTAVLSVFLRELLGYLVVEGYNDELSFTLSTIADNKYISKDVLIGILKSDIKFNNAFIVDDLLDTYILDLRDIIDIVEYRFEFTTNEDVLELFRKLYTTDENLIEILEIVKSQFFFIEGKNGKVKVKPRNTGKKKRFYNLVREFLTDVIVAEAEVDIWTHVSDTEQSYVQSKDLYLIELFNRFRDFLISKDRQEMMVNMFNMHKQEEFKNLFSYDEILSINQEINTVIYIYDLDILSPFKFFIRLFNINRFGVLSYDRSVYEIRTLIKERMEDVGLDTINCAIDKDTYNLLLNYN